MVSNLERLSRPKLLITSSAKGRYTIRENTVSFKLLILKFIKDFLEMAFAGKDFGAETSENSEFELVVSEDSEKKPSKQKVFKILSLNGNGENTYTNLIISLSDLISAIFIDYLYLSNSVREILR